MKSVLNVVRLIDRLMYWTVDGSVIESTKQAKYEQKDEPFQQELKAKYMHDSKKGANNCLFSTVCERASERAQSANTSNAESNGKSGKFYFQRNFPSPINLMSKLFNLLALARARTLALPPMQSVPFSLVLLFGRKTSNSN